jgi:cation diffusion facilitator CzcD-associated flavoprotein CzcO
MPIESHVDVLIVGAGISGIGAAYHLQDKCPDKTYAILERRQNLGGTWDLFRYPGIRSDSDMYTFGYSFRPWKQPEVVASGDAILSYLQEITEAYGIDERIRYGLHVLRASWSSRDARWTVYARREDTGEDVRVTCSFLFMCAGYYDYDEGHAPDFEGAERFGGQIVHPQKWTDDVSYEDKRVVVIGSGATAVTLIPELTKKAAHVTMLQRSPTYVVAKPGQDRVANWLRKRFPERFAYAITRWKNVLYMMFMYWYCRAKPERAKALLVGEARKMLGDDYDVGTHFTPSYDPWDQRVCLDPDGDFFGAIRSGRASVVTDEIDCFTEKGVRTVSGDEIEADLIITATGLQLKFLGGLEVDVDGKRVNLPETFAYKGMMCSDVPNLALSLGYTNASWTLKSDLTAEYVCRLLNHMDSRGYAYCCPRVNDPSLEAESILALSAGYIERGRHKFPKEATTAPWRLHQNYALDVMALRYASVNDDVMEFERLPEDADELAGARDVLPVRRP